MQISISPLMQQMKSQAEKPTSSDEILMQRLQRLETAQQTHEKTLSGHSEAQQALLGNLHSQLTRSIEEQVALRREISLLRDENSQLKATCENTRTRPGFGRCFKQKFFKHVFFSVF